jgi:hypothetical protein
MVKLLVFAERAVNGQPSANPCLQILDRAMRTNLLFLTTCRSVWRWEFFVLHWNDHLRPSEVDG